MGEKILIVGGDREYVDHLNSLLEEQGYLTSIAKDAAGILSFLNEEAYDLVLIDPDHLDEGLDFLETIQSRYPDSRMIIHTSSHSVELTIKAIRAGVVDYIEKPSPVTEVIDILKKALSEKDVNTRRELLIRNLATSLDQLKDLEGIRKEELPARRMLKLPGGVLIDLERRQIWKGGLQVNLTPTESNLLSVFLENRERVLSHVELVALLQGVTVEVDEAPEILRPMVSRLRKKLAEFPGTEKWVKNIRGTGYLFDPI